MLGIISQNRINKGWFIFAVICLISFSLMISSSSKESAIMDELAHISAGYSYINSFDFRLNPEHPPLLKALSAVPLLFLELNFPTDHPSWTKDVNGQWEVGNQFLYKDNGQNADLIIYLSRLFPMLLTILLGVFIYVWSKKIVGGLWSLLPPTLFLLSPNVLAHGHYVTTDIAATFGFFTAAFFFVRFLNDLSVKNIVWAGIFFGIAQLMKFSSVLLIPIFIFLALLYCLSKIKGKNIRIFSRESFCISWPIILKTLMVFLVGYILVWLVYAVLTWNYPIDRQIADTQNILNSFSPVLLSKIDVWIASVPILRGLGHYLLGVLMVLQRSSGGNTAYFMGEVGGGGWWNYFPVVFSLKETIPALLVILLGAVFALVRFFRGFGVGKRIKSYLLMNFQEITMIVIILVYWIYSIRSPLNIGFRHIMPTIPLLYILAANSLKNGLGSVTRGPGSVLKPILAILLAFWVLLEGVFSYPYFISYYNQLGGGTQRGYEYVTDSNYDWGQDLIRLRDFVDNQQINKIAVDYFGGGDTSYYLGERVVNWSSYKGSPTDSGINWLAVSINTLQSAKARTQEGFIRKPEDSYQWLDNYNNPYAKAGTSIFIYRLEGDKTIQ